MFIEKKYIIYVISTFILVQVAGAQTINVQFQSNKNEYICGEPVLLKTIVSNPSDQNFVGLHGGWIQDEYGFTIYVAYGEEDFNDILYAKTKMRLKISTPPRQFEFFVDRHFIHPNLSPGARATRLDMMIFPKPGDYKLKAVFKCKDGQVYASEPIQVSLLPLSEKYDSVSQFGEQDFLINLGSTIFYAHHLNELLGSYPPGKSLSAKEFQKLAPIIIEKHKDSVFREYVMYADIMAQSKSTQSELEIENHIKNRQMLAEHFIKEYPKSWLLPDVYYMLFFIHVKHGDKEKAEQIRNTVLQIAPDASVLNWAKRIDLSKLKTKK